MALGRDVVTVADDSTRSEIEEALGNVVATLRRMPDHWTERRATLRAKVDALLDDWQAAG